MEINNQTKRFFSFNKNLLINIMRIFVFLCCFTVFSFTPSNLASQNKKVVIDYDKEVTVDEVFDVIMKQTNYKFIYQEGLFNTYSKVNLKKGVIRVDALLNKSLTKGNFSYDYNEATNSIIIKAKTKQTSKQEKQVTGVVTNENGYPMVGATVLVENSTRGEITNLDGYYKISLKEGEDVLVFTSLGYKTERVKVGDRTIIDIVMKEDYNQLKEIVLIGYGEKTRDEVTGAVSSIKKNNIVQASTGTVGFDRSLGGLVKGLQVSQQTGRPGSPMRLNIRGITSPLSGFGRLNQPLFVIDGVPFNVDALQGANPLLTLNPNDIDSFDVLRDAAATAIYGSRGANGVIIIKTKSGKRNQKPTINLSYTTTLAQPINTVSVLNAAQYKNHYNTLITNSVNAMNAGQMDPFLSFDLANIGNVELDFSDYQVSYDGLRDDYFGSADTNWNDVVFRSIAVTKQANLSLNGGGKKSNYSFRLGFTDQEGLTVKDGLEQYTLGLSLNSDLTKKINVGGTVNFSHVKNKSGEENFFRQYTVNSSIAKARPDLPVYNENGTFYAQPDFAYGFETFEPNPLMRLQNITTNKSYNFIGNTFVEIEPVENLKLKADVNASVIQGDNSTFIPKRTQTNFVFFPTNTYLSESSSLVSNITTNLTANYKLHLADHHFNFLAGFAWDRTNFESKRHLYIDFPDDDVLINPTSAGTVLDYAGNRLETGLNSFFSRIGYNYKGLYSATLNFRTDVSSKFGPGNKRGYFPSISASWNIGNEEFLEDNETINALKLRASAGRVGSTNLPDFAYLQFFQTSANDGYNGGAGVLPNNTFPNINIGWEETEEVNLGVDFEVFNSRLRGGIDVYSRKTTGALANTPLPLELGPDQYFSNFVDISNKGVELNIGGDILRKEDFSWTADINWSFNRNTIDKINGANIDRFQMDNFVEGEPVGTIKGYKVVKIFQSQDEVDALNAASPTGLYDQAATSVGDYMFEDVNGDGRITIDDRTIIGDIEPDFYGGITNTFKYKNFTLTALMQYSVGAERAWGAIPYSAYNILGENKYTEYALNTWTPENTNARYARALYFDPALSSRNSDRYVYDTSYLRLKSLQLQYNFDKNLMKNIGITNASLMLTATNLVTWTQWPGLDPETFSERGNITDQVNNEDPYPLAKSVSLGVQVQF